MSITQPSENNNVNLGNEDNNVVCRIEEIDDDILSLILSRLSTWILLVQCRCVSKRWNIIISRQEFLRRLPSKLFPFTLYLETFSRKISIISEHPFFQSQNLPPEFDLITSYNNNHEYDFRFFGSYSDLLIFYYNRGIETPYYIICNPITNKYLKLVEDPNLFRGTLNEIVYVKAIGLAGNLDGVSSTYSSVKGDDHKGFRFVRIGAPKEYIEGTDTVEVFSSETGKWSRYPNVYRFSFCSSNSITLNNKLHWLGDNGILVIDPFSNDMTQYRIIKRPKYCLCNLGVCQNRLRLAWLSYEYSWVYSTTLTVWELEDYDDDSTWGAVYSKVLNRNMFQRLCGINGISFHPCDCDVVFLVNDNNIVVRYNLKSGTFEVVLDLPNTWMKLVPLVNPVVTP